MNILVLEDSSQSYYGGGQKISKLIIESLLKEYNVFLSDFTYSSLFYNEIAHLIQGSLILNSLFSSNIFVNRVFQILLIPINIFYLIRFINRNNISVLYATTKLSLVNAFILSLLTNVRFIYHAHMSFGSNVSDKVFSFFLSKSVFVIAVSNYVRDSIFVLNRKIHIYTIYNPIEFGIGNVKCLNALYDFNIAFFGAIKKEKGIDVLMKVVEHYSIIGSNLKFHFFGDGNLMSKIKKLRYDNLLIHGHVSNVEFFLDNNVALLLLPSIIPEACPTIILQAYSKGIPVITTNIGGQNELVQNNVNGFTVPINDYNSIVDSIDILLGNPNLYNKCSANNLQKVSIFNTLLEFETEIIKIFNKSI